MLWDKKMFIEFESTIRKIITIFEGIGVNEKDSDEIKLQKATLVAASFTMATLAIIWGSLYLYLDLVISASIPLTYCVLSYISIFTFHKSKNINFFRNSQLFFIVFLPFFLMLSLGGFVSSSVVIIWAVLGPFGALLFSNFKHAPLWFFLFIILTIIGGYVGYINYFPEPVISEFFVQMFFYMNIIAVFSLIFILFYYFINQKEIAVRLLKVLAENEFSDLINKMALEEKIVHDQKDLTPVFFNCK